jgi:SNF2 family DNA or RNA helicase
MYSTSTHRLTVDDFPNSFKLNRIFTIPVEFRDNARIVKAYDSLGITPQIVEDYIVNGTVTDSGHVLADITRARMLAESFKVIDIAEMAEDLMAIGKSVVIFVNYKDTVDALRIRLKCDRIDGRQTAADRQRVIDEFQSDQTHCIVVNAAAGGTGISLHDTVGNRPRAALISPTFNCKTYKQVLGRIHRNGGKTDAVQSVLVANGSIEEHVMRSIERRLRNLNTLHDA